MTEELEFSLCFWFRIDDSSLSFSSSFEKLDVARFGVDGVEDETILGKIQIHYFQISSTKGLSDRFVLSISYSAKVFDAASPQAFLDFLNCDAVLREVTVMIPRSLHPHPSLGSFHHHRHGVASS